LFRRLLLGVITLTLLAAVALQATMMLRPKPPPSLQTPLSEILPAAFPGWETQDLKLGATETLHERSENILRLNDFVYRQYDGGGHSFGVYVAYWHPGKMPVRLVNSHTPDRCWIENGWTCTDRSWDVDLTPKAGVPLQPAQQGVYEIQGFEQHVYFWHIVDGEVHWYGGERQNRYTTPTVILDDLRKFGLNVHREQFFVRVASPEPFDALWERAEFREVMQTLAELCLAPAQSEGANL